VDNKEQQSPFLAELVEPVNYYVNNPLATRLVKGLVKTPITPDQVTYTSILFGLASAFAFSQGTTQSIIVAGLLLEVTLILDCADGQLARAKNCASEWGRFLDGIAGYISYLSVVLGMMVGLQGHYGALSVITGFVILRAIAYDYCKQSLTGRIRLGIDESERDISDTFAKIQSTGSKTAVLYYYYLQVQQWIFHGRWCSLKQMNEIKMSVIEKKIWTDEQRNRYYQKFRPLMRVWSWNGPDLPLFLFIICSLLGILDKSLTPLATLMGIQFIATLLLHRNTVRREDNP
jgi:phosphatidylglycerophosphate synthase